MDHRADIYAFGVMAYELLTGVAPFTAPTAVQLVAAHLNRLPDPPSRLRPLIPEALDQIVLRCMAKRPADRFQSAEEIVHRLETLLRGPLSPDLVTTKEHAVAPSQFRISEGLVRRLSRDSFDPRMVGDSLEYLDNHARSETLVCLLPAVGLDAAAWDAHLRSLPYRAVAVTLYGFEPARRRRPTLPVSDHMVLLREFLRFIVERARPRTVLLAGFSSGADLALRLAGGRAVARVDAVLSLGCNLSLETCFVTRILATIDTRDPSRLLDGLRTVGTHTNALDAWVTVHKYLVLMLQKFQTQAEPLRRLARDIVAPFEGAGASPFIQWYRDAADQVRTVRCVFEDNAVYAPLVQDLVARQADAGILGPRYREGSLVVEPGTHHFDLEAPDLVARHLEAIVAELALSAAARGEGAAAR
jgi:hypothetical protein